MSLWNPNLFGFVVGPRSASFALRPSRYGASRAVGAVRARGALSSFSFQLQVVSLCDTSPGQQLKKTCSSWATHFTSLHFFSTFHFSFFISHLFSFYSFFSFFHFFHFFSFFHFSHFFHFFIFLFVHFDQLFIVKR